MAEVPFVLVFAFVSWGLGAETRTKAGRGDGVGMYTIGSVVMGHIFEVLIWLTAPTPVSAMDKERLNSCAKCAMSVLALSSVASFLVAAVNGLMDTPPPSSMVGIVATLVDLALRRVSETCKGAWESSKKADDVKGERVEFTQRGTFKK